MLNDFAHLPVMTMKTLLTCILVGVGGFVVATSVVVGSLMRARELRDVWRVTPRQTSAHEIAGILRR